MARPALVGLVLGVMLTACGMSGTAPAPAGATQTGFVLPSTKGINYDGPRAADGQWLGTRWLRSDGGWDAARPRLGADLDFIASHHLGQVVRVFVGIDQLMVRDGAGGFARFDDAEVRNLDQALDMFDARHLSVIAVVFDQEEVSSPGNFHFEALDGRHAAMRGSYLTAVAQFFRRYGGRQTVIGWDLFNEAYNSLGTEGGLSRPPADDPVSPNYADGTVHAWIKDLYQAAKGAAPEARLTVSDTTELYWKDRPNTTRYEGAVDFYDIHVYDDHPQAKDWAHTLDKPYLLGEVGGDIENGFKDQSVNAQVVGFWLSHARELGIRAVLAHSAEDSIYSLRSGALTPTGRVLEGAR
jgi:Cellulase (glycosyl hydrolase family 5)